MGKSALCQILRLALGVSVFVTAISTSSRADFQATNPQPANEANGVLTVLSEVRWKPEKNATAQTIYFGTSFDDVNNGIIGINLSGTDSGYSDFTKPLNAQTNYYWRVDTIIDGTTYPGPVWTFNTVFAVNQYENFDTSWDYFVDGTCGTRWDNVIGEQHLLALNTDVNSGKLYMESNGQWGGQYGQGVLLYKEVVGPYIATVEVANMNGLYDSNHSVMNAVGTVPGQRAGLMARLPDLRQGRFGNDPDIEDEDWVGIWFYPTWNVGNMGSVQGWYFRTSGFIGGNNTMREFGRMWTGWPDNPNPTGSNGPSQNFKPYLNKSGRFLMIDYKGDGKFWLR